MPKEQALDFVQAEYNRGLGKESPSKEPADIAAEASQLLDDFLDREKVERHCVPSETRHLLMLMAEGVHLYPEELQTISEYVRSRQDHLQGETLPDEPFTVRNESWLQPLVQSFHVCLSVCLKLQLWMLRKTRGTCCHQD